MTFVNTLQRGRPTVSTVGAIGLVASTGCGSPQAFDWRVHIALSTCENGAAGVVKTPAAAPLNPLPKEWYVP